MISESHQRFTFVQRLVLAVVPRLMWALIWIVSPTWRFEVIAEEGVTPVLFGEEPGPEIYCFWHQCVLPCTVYFRRSRAVILISQAMDIPLLGVIPPSLHSGKPGRNVMAGLFHAVQGPGGGTRTPAPPSGGKTTRSFSGTMNISCLLVRIFTGRGDRQAVFFWPDRMISGFSELVTTFSVMMTFLAPFREGMSNMTSIIERLHDGPQAPGPGLPFDCLAGDGLDGALLELQLHVVQLEGGLVLLEDGVVRFRDDAPQGIRVQLFQGNDNGEPAHELGDEAVAV